MLSFGHLAMWALLAVGLFNSIMFPSIFTLGIEGLGPLTGEASGLLVMAIVGGPSSRITGLAGRPRRTAPCFHPAGALLSLHPVLRCERTATTEDSVRFVTPGRGSYASLIPKAVPLRTSNRGLLRTACEPPCRRIPTALCRRSKARSSSRVPASWRKAHSWRPVAKVAPRTVKASEGMLPISVAVGGAPPPSISTARDGPVLIPVHGVARVDDRVFKLSQ